MENAREDLIPQEPYPGNAGAAGECVPGDVLLEEYIDRIAEELHERVEHQRDVLRKVLCAGGAGREEVRYCPLVDCSRIEKLRAAIRETVGVLEETRSAFKSKRLELVRKRLVEILAES